MKDFVCLILTWKMMTLLLANVLSAMGLVACLILICFAQSAAQQSVQPTLGYAPVKNRYGLTMANSIFACLACVPNAANANR